MSNELTTPPVAAQTNQAISPAVNVPEGAILTVNDPQEPAFLKDRLDRERKSILKDLGVKLKRGEDPNDKLAELQSDLESQRAERKELREKVSKYEETISKLSQAEAAVKVFAEMEFNALSEAQKTIVKSAAGEDPNERLKTIAMMKATGMIPPVAASVPAEKPPIPEPAQTAPAIAAPPAAPSQPVDVKAEHERLRATNPLHAAAFLLQNREQFYQQK